jgi:exosortase/archaeosortase family protein
MKINTLLIKIWQKLKPFQGIIIFVLVMMLANTFWKWFVNDGDLDPAVTLFGIDITWPFRAVQREIIRVVGLVYELFGMPYGLQGHTTFVFLNGQASDIAWGCTGIKQAFIFICIIAFSRGSWKNKWWYILAALPFLHGFNVVRIAIVSSILAHNPSLFDFIHAYIFKYSFYMLIFLLWMLFEEFYYLRPKRRLSAPKNG